MLCNCRMRRAILFAIRFASVDITTGAMIHSAQNDAFGKRIFLLLKSNQCQPPQSATAPRPRRHLVRWRTIKLTSPYDSMPAILIEIYIKLLMNKTAAATSCVDLFEITVYFSNFRSTKPQHPTFSSFKTCPQLTCKV